MSSSCYSDSEEEENSSVCEKRQRFRNVYNYTKVKTKSKSGSSTQKKVNNILAIPKDLAISFQQNLSRALKKDADFLVQKTTGLTNVVVCAILERKQSPTENDLAHSTAKKFVFTNLFEYEGHHANFNDQFDFVQAAHSMGYHVVQAQQSHAEMALLQFLEERSHVYNAMPVAMGCSNHVCKLCVEFLSLLWGPHWSKLFHMETSTQTHHHWYTPAALIAIIMKDPEKTNSFRKEHKVVIPDYAEHWAENAPDYIGCTDGGAYPVWSCSVKKLCWTHGPTFKGHKAPRRLKLQYSHSAGKLGDYKQEFRHSSSPVQVPPPPPPPMPHQHNHGPHGAMNCLPWAFQQQEAPHWYAQAAQQPPAPPFYGNHGYNASGHLVHSRSDSQLWGHPGYRHPVPQCGSQGHAGYHHPEPQGGFHGSPAGGPSDGNSKLGFVLHSFFNPRGKFYKGGSS